MVVVVWWLFPHLRGFGEMFNHLFPTCASFLSFFFPKWRLAHVHYFHSLCQDQSTVAQRAETTVAECFLTSACGLVSRQVPTLCLDSSIVSLLRLHWVMGVCMFRCNLPPALLAKWPGSFTCHCGNTGVEQTTNKSQHTKLTLEEKNLPPLLSRFKLATFRSGTLTNKLFQPPVNGVCIIPKNTESRWHLIFLPFLMNTGCIQCWT